MKKIIFLLILTISFSNCKSSKTAKSTKSSTKKTVTKSTKSSSKAQNIINYATQFKGVKYKWGGTTKKGMDCSGLIYTSFTANNVQIPRISRDMAKRGTKISLKNVHKGDLLFFKTGKNKRSTINHVGLIVDIRNNDIKFIHATTSKGVIVSGLNEKYWLNAFVEARSIL
ncbi:C40 family peptidase [Neotamlana laminarinivorans]|uniref:C40 family peptidase n=1 Tax=Neotamlana laminarinivorans TaxID=2883124 RepID=A0A9X1L0B3_9FLAO|nr:C40 family peptidase [Tamlana laminarinivorans]MCB4797265.1 C40 family peptidase [Tamlana laminarinivorans]